MNAKIYNELKEYALEAMKGSTDFRHYRQASSKGRKKRFENGQDSGFRPRNRLNLMGAICYLHDLAFTKHDPGLINYVREGKRVKSIVTELLKKYDIPKSEKEIIVSTRYGRHHVVFSLSKAQQKEDNYAKILQDADTLDEFTSERISIL